MRKNFTVVTPNYNMGEYLSETIESVVANLRPGDEYFIIDGGSTDNSLEIIRRYEQHLTGWVSEKDHGYADAIAKGFAQSRAEYQCWVNCGDLLLPGALDEARVLLSEFDTDMIFGDDFYIDEKGAVLQVTNGHAHDLAVMMLYAGWTPLQEACYWRKALYDRVGGIDSNMRFAADYDLFLRMSLNGRCRYVPVIFSAFRRHGGQISGAHAKNYQLECAQSRRREIAAGSYKRWYLGLLCGYYWFKLRWRMRMLGHKYGMSHLKGASISNLKCQKTSLI